VNAASAEVPDVGASPGKYPVTLWYLPGSF